MQATEQKLQAFFADHKCPLYDVGLLQPADPILNAVGEDIRRRIFITADQHGTDFCLRPEFTIPVCLDHIKSGKLKKRYGYMGKVFRQRNDESAEFMQAGIEDIGAKNTVAADVKSLEDAVLMIRQLGKNRLSVALGDQAIFEAVLKSLGLPKAWREKLGRSFGDTQRISADLDRLSGRASDILDNLSDEMNDAIQRKDKVAVIQQISEQMKRADLSPKAGRSPEEIAARLMENAKLASTNLSEEKREILEGFLKLDIPLAKANSKLWAFARRYQIPLGDALEVFHKRVSAIEKLDLENVSLRYKAGFGRQLDYYTGFVFEIKASGQRDDKPLAGGGRYDRLMNLLGSKEHVPAIGFAVYMDRIVNSRGQTL